jgi:7-cyano-7-deazaguanine reductase
MSIKTFNDTSSIQKLGAGSTKYDYDEPLAGILETFANTAEGRDYIITLDIPEWTGKCPVTNQPDFAHIVIKYIPNKRCIETKSLKLYTFAYRNYGCFMESTTNKFIDDIVSACDPKWIHVSAKFNARGGIGLDVSAEYYSAEYKSSSTVVCSCT